MEVWKQIDGWPYEVSDLGRVRGARGILAPVANGRGYVSVKLRSPGRYRRYYLHRLVAMAFVPLVEGCPCVNHKDGNKANNCVDNLEWTDDAANKRHAVGLGLYEQGERRYNAKLTNSDVREIRHLCASGVPQRLVGIAFGISQGGVSQIVTRRKWSHVA